MEEKSEAQLGHPLQEKESVIRDVADVCWLCWEVMEFHVTQVH